jgi:hypothetical protein
VGRSGPLRSPFQTHDPAHKVDRIRQYDPPYGTSRPRIEKVGWVARSNGYLFESQLGPLDWTRQQARSTHRDATSPRVHGGSQWCAALSASTVRIGRQGEMELDRLTHPTSSPSRRRRVFQLRACHRDGR